MLGYLYLYNDFMPLGNLLLLIGILDIAVNNIIMTYPSHLGVGNSTI